MDHQEKHHEHHKKEREEHNKEEKLRDAQQEKRPTGIHPGWFLAAGVVLIVGVLVVWIVVWAW